MLKFPQKFFLSRLVSSTLGIFLHKQGSRVLMYHSISSDRNSNSNEIYKINKNNFLLQQNKLAGMQDISVVALDSISGNHNEVAITFDDGFRNTYEVAASVLAELKLPFTVFVTPEFIEKGYENYLSKKSLLSLSEIPNCTIGAHGYSHCRLTECDDVKLSNELIDSKKWLEDVLGKTVDMMSYPHGAVDIRVRDMVEQVGYKIAASSKAGANLSTQDMLQLRRTDIWSLDNCQTFTQKVKGQWDWI